MTLEWMPDGGFGLHLNVIGLAPLSTGVKHRDLMRTERPIEKFEEDAELRLEWDNRKAHHDRFMLWFFLLFWIVWAPVTVFATWMIFRSGSPVFFSIWCVFG